MMNSSIVHAYSLYGLGIDVGRYLYRICGIDISHEELVRNATEFVNTFDTTFNSTDTHQLAEFMLGVGHGYRDAQDE